MPETYYQSAHTGKQIDDAISLIASGEFDRLAEETVAAKNAAATAAFNAAISEENAKASETKAKLYSDQTEASVSGVVSFNGRGGHVMPQSGDYTAEMVGAAPASRGLYRNTSYLGASKDLNTLTGCGFYSYTHNGVPVNGFRLDDPYQYIYHLEVSSENNGTITQAITTCGVSDGDGNYRVRRVLSLSTAKWSAWEYENPPLKPDVEYRTTERINGKVVFKRSNNGIIEYRLYNETTWKRYDSLIVGTGNTILHTGNKPSGSYTGNGDATSRVFETGGIGKELLLYSATMFAIVTHIGALYRKSDGSWARTEDVVYNNGRFTVATTLGAFNASGTVYYYKGL